MKTCPNCGELVGDTVEICFNCNYKFKKQKPLDTEHQKFITTGHNFEGYNITSYFGIASGSAVMGSGALSEVRASISDFLGTYSGRFSNIISDAEQAALNMLIKNSEAMGGNAIIGVDFDYLVFGSNMIGVAAKGTSVFIEKK